VAEGVELGAEFGLVEELVDEWFNGGCLGWISHGRGLGHEYGGLDCYGEGSDKGFGKGNHVR